MAEIPYFMKRQACMLFRPKPIIYAELENMTHYASAGFDALDPVSWGWQQDKGGGKKFSLDHRSDRLQATPGIS